jgi:hypothetical protein
MHLIAVAYLAILLSGCAGPGKREPALSAGTLERYRGLAARRAADRVALVEAFGQADEALAAALARDVNDDVAIAAAIALGRDREKRTDVAVQALCRLVDDPRSEVRQVAFLSLFNLVLNQPGDFDEEHVVPAVLKGLRDQDLAVSQLALVPTEYMADPAVLAEQLRLIGNPYTPVGMRSHLAWVVGEQKQDYAVRAVPALLDCLDVSGHFFLYYHAASSLKSITGVDLDRPEQPIRWEEYRDLYGSDEWRVRTKAFYTQWGAVAGKDLLEDPLAGCPPIEDPQVTALVKRMQSEDWPDRQVATRELIRQHPDARRVLEHLARARDVALALQAHKGLRVLDSKPLTQRHYRLERLRPMLAGKPAKSSKPSGPPYASTPFEFESVVAGGGSIVDLDGDGVTEFLISGWSGEGEKATAVLAAHSHQGRLLWSVQDREGFGAIPPGAVAEFVIDGQPQRCIVALLQDGRVDLRSSRGGELVASAGPFRMHDGRPFDREPIENAHRAVIRLANLTGAGRCNVVIAKGRSVITLGNDLRPYWNMTVEGAFSHSQLQVADIDGDGRHELFVGGTAIGPDGRILHTMTAGAHVDDVAAADFLPDRPGLEIMYAQERGADAVLLCDAKGLIWQQATGEEPQVLVPGEYDPASPGAEAYCPARGGRRPFIISGTGRVLVGFGDATNGGAGSPYPLGWDAHLLGTEQEQAKSHLGDVLGSGDWDGDGVDELLIRRSGSTELVNPVTWEPVLTIKGIAGWTLLTQVCGDSRPELVIRFGNRWFVWGHQDEARQAAARSGSR